MPNPFKELKNQYIVNKMIEEGFEEVDGPLQCQTRDCHEAVPEGLYSESERVLTWRCSNGHISKMENFVA